MENTSHENKQLTINMMVEKSFVTVSVCDNGHGIDETIKNDLFKPFVTSRESGFGIGLAVSSSIIEKHNGEIRAGNVKGGGAEFSFRLAVV